MEKHRAIIQPKFAIVEEKLNGSLAGRDIASWTKPNGGYFISLDTTFQVADQVIKLAEKSEAHRIAYVSWEKFYNCHTWD